MTLLALKLHKSGHLKRMYIFYSTALNVIDFVLHNLRNYSVIYGIFAQIEKTLLSCNYGIALVLKASMLLLGIF